MNEQMSEAATKSEDHKSVFLLEIQDKQQLLQAFMPFIRGGGLFIATEQNFSLGDQVFLLVQLFDEPEKFTVSGKVVWITPNCAQGGRVTGIGVQFDANASTLLAPKIDTYLAGAAQAERPNDTM